MKNDIYLIGEVGFEITLKSVVDAVNESDKNKPLNVHIHTGGGSVFDGLAIYNYFKTLKQEVHTKSAGLVASIGSIIFLAGKKETRTINSNDNFLIHLPEGMGFGNAEDLEKNAKMLRDIENKISDIYEKETDITKEEAMELMKKDEMMDIDFLKDKGFVAEIVEFKAVANFNNKTMKKDAVTKQEVETILDKFINKSFPKKEPKNKIVQDANGIELNFMDLEDSDTVAVGDKAMVDGANATGDYILPSGETYTFADGELTVIVDAEEGDEETIESLKQEIERLKDELGTNAQTVTDAEAEVTTLTNKVKKLKKATLKLKDKITGSFDYSNKNKKKDNDGKSTSRSLFKVG